jgi:hypothetical protein
MRRLRVAKAGGSELCGSDRIVMLLRTEGQRQALAELGREIDSQYASTGAGDGSA